MEQDEDADPHRGRRPRGHLRLRADGARAGAPRDAARGGWDLTSSVIRSPDGAKRNPGVNRTDIGPRISLRSIRATRLWNAGSPAFAGDDGCGLGPPSR